MKIKSVDLDNRIKFVAFDTFWLRICTKVDPGAVAKLY